MYNSPNVYLLRIAYIVLQACLPVVAALVFVAKDALVFDPISYLFIAVAVIGLLFSLSLNYTKLPHSVLGMLKLFLFPIVFITLAQVLYHEHWSINLAYLTTQELLSASIITGWLWWYEQRQSPKELTLIWFLAIMALAQIIAMLTIYYSAYRLDQASPNWLLIVTAVYMVVSAYLEARVVYASNEKSINQLSAKKK